MTRQIVGYQLRRVATNEIVERWGGVWGHCPGLPSLLVIPSDEGAPPLQICAPVLGDDYDGHVLETWEMDESPTPILPISDRQFFQQAALQGLITQAEALAAVQTGAIPALLQTILDGIAGANEKFAAQMILSGATTFERNHTLTQSLGVALGWSTEQIDQFFRDAAAL